MLNTAIESFLVDLKHRGLHRQRVTNGSSWINFSSNDYLSLTTESHIKNAFQRGFASYPAGSGGSMVVCGYHPAHRELEQAFSQALNVDDALLFSSGYAANLAVVSLLAHFNSHLIMDKGAHASFYDGITLTKIPHDRYFHNDLNHLAFKLEPLTNASHHPVVITESVFSMSGQATNLARLSSLCSQSGAACIVDEAHAFGIMGPQGLGAIAQYGLTQQNIPLRIIPLGKAFAFQGAIVAGASQWIDALLQLARSHIYSTAVSPALAHGMLDTLAFIQAADDRRQKIAQLIAYFQNKCQQSLLNWGVSSTPIQQLRLSCPHKALNYTNYLRSKGIVCLAMREPTVSKKNTGLRVILNYRHEIEQIDSLFAHLHHIAATYDSSY